MSEHQEQCAVFEWADLMVRSDQMPELINLYAIPNGGHRHKSTAARLKAEGVKSGVLDLHLPVARRGYIGFWAEMKWGKNKLTNNQRDWYERLEDEGHFCTVCYDADFAIGRLKWYLSNG